MSTNSMLGGLQEFRPELWKLADVAAFLHVHRNTASKWLKKVNLPVVNIGAKRGSRKGKRWHNSMVISAARAEAPRKIGKEAA